MPDHIYTVHRKTAIGGTLQLQEQTLPENTVSSESPSMKLPTWTLLATFFSITCSTGFAAIVNGMFTVEIPTIANDIGLDQSLLMWPLSVNSLVTAATLLLGGSIVDIVGDKPVYITANPCSRRLYIGQWFRSKQCRDHCL